MNEDPRLQDLALTDGVLTRRVFAWLLDALFITALMIVVWLLCLMFAILTLGLGHVAFAILPAVPFAYNFLFLIGGRAATPGQMLMGLTVRQLDTLAPPNAAQALVSTIGYYVTVATLGLLLLVALLTRNKRTLHDLVSGLVVVRSGFLRSAALTQPGPAWNMGRRPI